MNNKKCIILITGTTCVGKSTVLEALKSIELSSTMIIPQVTTRQPRTDDDSSLIIYQDRLDPDKLFLYNKELTYGISKHSISKFLSSEHQVALMITGTDEMEMLKKMAKGQNFRNVNFKNILITYSKDYHKELQALESELPKFFDKTNIKKRFNFFRGHIKDKLLNPAFIDKNIDVHLTREMSLVRWSYELSKLIKSSPSKILCALEKKINDNKKQQKNYLSYDKKYIISQIISSLKGNKR